ncbi:hypothetical protein [Halalkalicoccus ordinarius]|uniref:hypothetical protein n=1 Tax=Halalkalicoccus ordinarius TaxID=3116651 RepID=UPI00300E949A
MAAEFSTAGSLSGILESPLLADTRVALFLRVRNRNASEDVSTAMFQQVIGSGVLESEEIDTDFTGAIDYDLQPDDNHIAWIRLVARIETEDLDLGFLPVSDFGSSGRDAVFSHIDVSFPD